MLENNRVLSTSSGRSHSLTKDFPLTSKLLLDDSKQVSPEHIRVSGVALSILSGFIIPAVTLLVDTAVLVYIRIQEMNIVAAPPKKPNTPTKTPFLQLSAKKAAQVSAGVLGSGSIYAYLTGWFNAASSGVVTSTSIFSGLSATYAAAYTVITAGVLGSLWKWHQSIKSAPAQLDEVRVEPNPRRNPELFRPEDPPQYAGRFIPEHLHRKEEPLQDDHPALIPVEPEVPVVRDDLDDAEADLIIHGAEDDGDSSPIPAAVLDLDHLVGDEPLFDAPFGRSVSDHPHPLSRSVSGLRSPRQAFPKSRSYSMLSSLSSAEAAVDLSASTASVAGSLADSMVSLAGSQAEMGIPRVASYDELARSDLYESGLYESSFDIIDPLDFPFHIGPAKQTAIQTYKQDFVDTGVFNEYTQHEKHRIALRMLERRAQELIPSLSRLPHDSITALSKSLEGNLKSDAVPNPVSYYEDRRSRYLSSAPSYAYQLGSLSDGLFFNIYFALKALEDRSLTPTDRSHIFICFLRSAVASFEDFKKNQDAIALYNELVLPLCEERFEGLSLFSYLEDLLRIFTPEFRLRSDTITFDNLPDTIAALNHAIECAPGSVKPNSWALKWQKLRGTLGLYFDPNNQTNTPNTQSTHMVQKDDSVPFQVTHMRHGTTTRQIVGLARMIEEYDAFVEAKKRKGQKVGYFCLQQLHGFLSPEASRAQAIQSLEGKHTNFDFFALPFDGPIFKCEGRFASASDEEYRNTVINSLIGGTNNFCLPASLEDKKRFRADLLALFNHVHQFYFNGNNTEGNIEQRQLLLFFFYAYLVDYFIAELNLEFIVTACKDNKDRGGALTSLCQILRILKTGQVENPGMLYAFVVNLFGPALLTKGEEIINRNRLDVLKRAVALLAHLFQTQPSKIADIQRDQDRLPGRAVVSDFNYIMPEEEEQSAIGSIRGSETLEQLTERIDRLDGKRWDWHPEPTLIHDCLKQMSRKTDDAKDDFEGDIPQADLTLLNAAEIYKKVRKDVTRSEIIVKFKQGGELVIERCHTLQDITRALNLPDNPEDIRLDDPEIGPKQQMALKVMAFANQVTLPDCTVGVQKIFPPHDSPVGVFVKQRDTNKCEEGAPKSIKDSTCNTLIEIVFLPGSPDDDIPEVFKVVTKTHFALHNLKDMTRTLRPESDIPFRDICAFTNIILKSPKNLKEERAETDWRFV